MSGPSRWSRRQILLGLGALPLAACQRREVVPAPATLRVASQTVLSDEVLWDLGEAVHAKVVAVSTMADDVRYSRVAEQWPSTIPRAAGSSEALLALQPTLVIVASFTAAETLRLLGDAGVQMLRLERFDGFDDYRANVRAIAQAVDAPEAGEQVVAQFDARLASLRRKGASGPRVLSFDEGSVPGAGTSFDDIATAAGLRNLPAEQGRRGHLQVSLEQLVAWDPDVLVVPCGDASCEDAVAGIAERPGIRSTRAAREGRIIGIPSRDLYSTGRGMLAVLERLSMVAEGLAR